MKSRDRRCRVGVIDGGRNRLEYEEEGAEDRLWPAISCDSVRSQAWSYVLLNERITAATLLMINIRGFYSSSIRAETAGRVLPSYNLTERFSVGIVRSGYS